METIELKNVQMKPIKLIKVGSDILDKDITEIEKIVAMNQFNDLELLGSGCYGTVRKYISSDGKEYAVKYAKKESFFSYVETNCDIQTLLLLRGDKHIINIHAYDEISMKDYFIMVMDFIDGFTLEDFDDEYPLNENFISFYEETLDYLKQNMISINDLHSSNIMVNHEGLPFIIDFGAMYQVDDDSKLNWDDEFGYRGSLSYVEKTYFEHLKRIKQEKYKDETKQIA